MPHTSPILPSPDTPKPKELIILASIPLIRARCWCLCLLHWMRWENSPAVKLLFLESQPLGRESSALTIWPRLLGSILQHLKIDIFCRNILKVQLFFLHDMPSCLMISMEVMDLTVTPPPISDMSNSDTAYTTKKHHH